MGTGASRARRTSASTRQSRAHRGSEPPRCARPPRWSASGARSHVARRVGPCGPDITIAAGANFEEVAMGRLIRLDRTGHTTLAEWTEGAESEDAAVAAFRQELDRGMIASVSYGNGTAEVVRELPLDADLVVMR